MTILKYNQRYPKVHITVIVIKTVVEFHQIVAGMIDVSESNNIKTDVAALRFLLGITLSFLIILP